MECLVETQILLVGHKKSDQLNANTVDQISDQRNSYMFWSGLSEHLLMRTFTFTRIMK